MMPTEITLHDVESVQLVTNKSQTGYWVTMKVIQNGQTTELTLWPKDSQSIELILGEME